MGAPVQRDVKVAVRELLNQAAQRIGIRQIAVPQALHERLWVIKYTLFVALVALSFYSMERSLVLAEAEGKATVAAGVTPDLVDRISAVTLVQTATAALGGKGGGGRPDRAQGGAPSLEAAESAIAEVEKLIGETA